MENKNAKSWPKIKTAKFLTAGLVSYKDVDAGIALLKNQTINEALSSFAGKPVIIDHSDVTPANYEKYRKGNVISARFEPADGWYYVTFIVDGDDAIDCIENKGYSVSCAYNVIDVAAGGLYQDIPYDGEITKISFTHLALVTEPRYEESRILDEMPLMMVNSKIPAHNLSKQEENKMFKLFQKNKEGEQKEVTPFVLINGKEVPLNALVDTYVANAKNEKDGKTGDMDDKTLYEAKDDDIVDVNGNKIRIGDMKNAYMSMKNEKDEAEKMKKDGVEDKKNEKKDEQEKDVEKEKDKEHKPEGAAEESPKRAKENAKKQGDEFFAQLSEAENSKDKFNDETTFSPRFGMTRNERANGWKDRVSKNMAAR